MKNIYVRTSPISNKKILIREDQKSEVEEAWAIKMGRTMNMLKKKKKRTDGKPTYLSKVTNHLIRRARPIKNGPF